MKKSIFQLCIIFVIILGSVGIIIAINNSNSNDNKFYVPNINEKEITSTPDSYDIEGYKEIEYYSYNFPKYSNVIYGYTYFNVDSAYDDYQLDIINVKKGQKLQRDELIGSYLGNDINIGYNGIVVDIEDGIVTVKNLSSVYLNFSYSIYSNFHYEIGYKFNVIKNNEGISDAVIYDIDYINIEDDMIKAVVKIDNSNNTIISDTSVFLVPSNTKFEESYSINADSIGFRKYEYSVLDNTTNGIYIEDGQVVEVLLSYKLNCFGKIKFDICKKNGDALELNGGKLYVKTIN